jgi:hypothetical protein
MQRRSEDDATDREAIRREIRAYVVEVLTENEIGGKNPWHWLISLLKCTARWEARADQAIELAWRVLLGAMIIGAAGWLGTAYLRWSGAGW